MHRRLTPAEFGNGWIWQRSWCSLVRFGSDRRTSGGRLSREFIVSLVDTRAPQLPETC